MRKNKSIQSATLVFVLQALLSLNLGSVHGERIGCLKYNLDFITIVGILAFYDVTLFDLKIF